MGGNGFRSDYLGVITMGSKRLYNKIPPDAGGGCVKEGPFAKYYRPRFLTSFLLSLPFFSDACTAWLYLRPIGGVLLEIL